MKFYFESYGCTMNQGEGRIMEDLLREKGHKITNKIEDSDALVLVTCTVIETTELKMKKRLLEFSSSRKPVIVSGCMASVQKEEILKINPEAKVLAPQNMEDITEVVKSLELGEELKGTLGGVKIETRNGIDAIVPISSGCLGSCTYCITRIARGALKSCPPDILIRSMKMAIENGQKEIRLTSQDTAAYGIDIDTDLPHLLSMVGELEGEFRVRVGMMNPDTASPIMDRLVSEYKDKRIYRFLHLPVQSGSEMMLEAMGRKYSIEEFFVIINQFRDNIPDITISTDVIVGFPGEEEEDHKKTVELIKKLRPNILNVTRFSRRPGTEAAKFDKQVVGRIAKERSRELVKVHEEISGELNKEFVGRKELVLITEFGKPGTMMGRTNCYKPVVIGDEVPLGRFIDVEITEARSTYLIGRTL